MKNTLLEEHKKNQNESDGRIELVNTLFLKKGETTVEEFFEQYYDFKKLNKWLNFFPIIWRTSDFDFSYVGSEAEFHIFFSIIKFKIKCEKILPNHRGIVASISGSFNGTGLYEFIETDQGILHRHVMNVKGFSNPIQKKCHIKCVEWRLNNLKRILIKQTKKRKQEENR